MREKGAACFEKLLLWDTAVYIIFTTPLKRAVNISLFYSFFFFQPPGFWKLYEVCQLPGWTVLRVSLSPRRARRGRRAGVEIRRRDESVPAMPQELHSRVRALFSQPESWHYLLPVLQTLVCCNVDAETRSKPRRVSCGYVGADRRERSARRMRQYLQRLMKKLDSYGGIRWAEQSKKSAGHFAFTK